MSNYDRVYNSIYRGIVEDNKDPENIGRCKVRVPAVHGELTYPIDILPWSRPVVLSPVSKGRGNVNIPDIGDIVWVIFEGANKDFPVYLGGTYAVGDIPIDKSIVDIYLEKNTRISYNRDYDYLLIQSGENIMKISPDRIELVGDTKISGNLEVKGSVSISNNLYVGGLTTVDRLEINSSCNRECDCT